MAEEEMLISEFAWEKPRHQPGTSRTPSGRTEDSGRERVRGLEAIGR